MKFPSGHLGWAAGLALLLAAGPVFGAPDPSAEASAALQKIWRQRADLQAVFDVSGKLLPASKIKNLASLEDWARQYGHKEHPKDLAPFAPVGAEEEVIPAALLKPAGVKAPAKVRGAAFNWATVTAKAVYVVDENSREVLLSRNAKIQRPMASLTKLMTALVALDEGIPMDGTATVLPQDEVGGARLRLADGTPLTVRDIFYSMIVGSANNCANAMVRVTGAKRDDFVGLMNARAVESGLAHTRFADPSGIEVGNVSTAEEVAALAFNAFDRQEIRRAASTAVYSVELPEGAHLVKNTNAVLTNNKNGIKVLGGKTGYLPESGWHLAMKVRMPGKPAIMVVVMGSSTQNRATIDAERVAKWVWKNFRWK